MIGNKGHNSSVIELTAMDSAELVSSAVSPTAHEGRGTAMLVGLLIRGGTGLSPISAREGMCCFFLAVW